MSAPTAMVRRRVVLNNAVAGASAKSAEGFAAAGEMSQAMAVMVARNHDAASPATTRRDSNRTRGMRGIVSERQAVPHRTGPVALAGKPPCGTKGDKKGAIEWATFFSARLPYFRRRSLGPLLQRTGFRKVAGG